MRHFPSNFVLFTRSHTYKTINTTKTNTKLIKLTRTMTRLSLKDTEDNANYTLNNLYVHKKELHA